MLEEIPCDLGKLKFVIFFDTSRSTLVLRVTIIIVSLWQYVRIEEIDAILISDTGKQCLANRQVIRELFLRTPYIYSARNNQPFLFFFKKQQLTATKLIV